MTKRGAGRSGRPGERLAKSWCFLCESEHKATKGVCPLTPEQREAAILRRQARRKP